MCKYALFVKGTINQTDVDQPRKYTRICNSEDEVREAFEQYCRLEGYAGQRIKREAMRLLEHGCVDGRVEDFSFIATLVRFELGATAY